MSTSKENTRQAMDEATAFLASNLPKAAKELLDWHTTGLLDEGGVIRNACTMLQSIVVPKSSALSIVENIAVGLTLKQYLKMQQRLDN